MVHQYLPEVEVLTCYASIQNLKAKSLEDLKLLKSVGYDELYVGLETAYAPAVKLINKGFTVEEAYENIGKLKEAGMKYSALLQLRLIRVSKRLLKWEMVLFQHTLHMKQLISNL